MATKTAVIVLHREEIIIWAIPPLSPQPPDFFDHNPTHILPLFTTPFPELHPALIRFNTISSWYFGSSRPLFFDMLCQDSKLRRFQIILEPDLSTASLRVVNISELTPLIFEYIRFQEYTICEDALVSCHKNSRYEKWGVYMGSMSGRPANIVSLGGLEVNRMLSDINHKYIFFSCPTSGRFVRLDSRNTIAVLDFF